jgi:hypothetical protein
MQARVFLLTIFSILIGSGCVLGKADYFPADDFLPGWKGYPVDEYRNAEDLFDYMNGGAELYLEYRYAGVQVKEFNSDDGDYLTIEVYAYAEPWDAFGIFSVDTTGAPVDLGNGGQTSKVMTRFWKGNFYVRIFVWDKKPELEGIPGQVAREVEAKLPENSKGLPYLKKLDQAALHHSFVRGEIALRQVAGRIDPGDISFDRKRGAVWVFPSGEETAGALVSGYGTPEKSQREFDKIWENIKTHAGGHVQMGNRGIASLTEGGSSGVERYDEGEIKVIIWVPRAKNEAVCAETIDRIKDALSGIEE